MKLQVESKKKHGKAETKVAKAKIKAGKSKFVKIVPKRKFVAKLDKAKKAIVREVLSAAGSKMRTVRRLRLLHR